VLGIKRVLSVSQWRAYRF